MVNKTEDRDGCSKPYPKESLVHRNQRRPAMGEGFAFTLAILMSSLEGIISMIFNVLLANFRRSQSYNEKSNFTLLLLN